MFFVCKFSRKTAIKFQKSFCVTLFQKFITIIWNNSICMKTNLEFRNKIYFKKHLLTNIQQNVLPKMMEWLRDATNALEQED